MNYILNTQQQQKEMLKRCGASSIEDLFHDIPKALQPRSFALPDGSSEYEVAALLRGLSFRNTTGLVSFLGAGFYDHYIPAAVDALTSRSEFYTAYTPYQPELSQGTLQAIYEYQSSICRLTGMEVANASLYDGGTALYEAVSLAVHATGRTRILVDDGVNPLYRRMLRSYAVNLHADVQEIPPHAFSLDRNTLKARLDASVAAVVVQNPNFFGVIDDYTDIAAQCRAHEILLIQSTYPISLGLIKSPGEMNVDIVTGEGQSLGIPLSFGGPYLGFMATKKELVRRLPGRIAGRTKDSRGREGFVLTLQAREQHIRREKATSNICTNEALCALRAHIYLSLLGKQGLAGLAQLCFNKAEYAKQRFKTISSVTVSDSHPTFNEFVLRLPIDADEAVAALMKKGFVAGFPLGRFYKGLEQHMLVAFTEKRTKEEIDHLAEALDKYADRATHKAAS